MNTKTMRLPPRRILTPNKRKESEGVVNALSTTKKQKPDSPLPDSNKEPDPAPSNQLLAGYLAHEFLTKGTLFGQPWDPARAESSPAASVSKSMEAKPSESPESEAEPHVENIQRYLEVADLMNRVWSNSIGSQMLGGS
ncbi:uncharacterized protein LOC107425815 [Ziziphus jujuba]|uniref:Uncharacterized protein LOC107425815 n=1 Tax=Ziziphus jujuba TaxID=326968 RepID=A0A6P4AQK6_ZIZJJ|nr:uncharacterized protein LOC107425815 [Ziziphus jujuba]